MSYRVIKEGLEREKGGTQGEKKKERDVVQHSSGPRPGTVSRRSEKGYHIIEFTR